MPLPGEPAPPGPAPSGRTPGDYVPPPPADPTIVRHAPPPRVPRGERRAPGPPRPPAPPTPTTEQTVYGDVRVASPLVGVLVATRGELAGEVYKVSDGENVLGRDPRCAIQLPSRRISREHARLVHQDGVFAIQPLNERNATYVNDKATEGACAINDGDELRLGDTTFRFRSVV